MWEASWRNYELTRERDAAIARAAQAERERDAALARVQELETWTRSVATRLVGCERWDSTFATQRFVGCDEHRSDDPNEWCIGCEAQALVEGRAVLSVTQHCGDAALDERRRIIEWLRATPGEQGLPWVDMARTVADDIERGEHLAYEPSTEEP